MKRSLLVAAFPLLLAILGASGTCSDSQKGGALPEEEGTIHRGVGPECPQTWHIATSDGRILWPVEDPAFQQEGLEVMFTARPRPDAMSICMAGTIVDVISIRKK